MSATAIEMHTAVRSICATPIRSGVITLGVAAPVAVATVASLRAWDDATGLVWAAGSAAVALVTVAQASPEPLRLASEEAWRDSGATNRRRRRPAKLAGVLLAWVSIAVGLSAGMFVAAVSGSDVRRGPISWGFWVALAAAAAVALSRQEGRSSPGRAVRSERRVLPALVVVCVASAVAIVASASITTDSDATLLIPVIVLMVTLVMMVLLVPAEQGVLRAAGAARPLRAVEVAASGYRTSALVRVVLTVSMLVALTGTVLGASVAARSNPYQPVLDEIAALPVLPPNVAALVPSSAVGAPSDESAAAASVELVGAVEREVGGALAVATTEVSNDPIQSLLAMGCSGEAVTCGERVLRPDPRLGMIPGLLESQGASGLGQAGPIDRIVAGWEEGIPLPSESWAGLHGTEAIEPLGQTAQTRPGPVYVTRAQAFTAEERAEMARIALAVAESSGASVELTTSDDLTGPVPSRAPGEVPWAPTDPGVRWVWTAIAAGLSLLVALATVAVAAHDRKATNDRLELLGATRGEVRGALALHTGVLLGLSALLTSAITIGLIWFGLDTFNDKRPLLAIPFTVPFAPVVLLVVGVPVAGATVAALVARVGPRHRMSP